VTTPIFALVAGLAYLGLGVLGLIGLLRLDLLHAAVYLLTGLWGIGAWAGLTGALTFARLLAVLYGVFALAGLIAGLDAWFWLHGATALVAAYFGWRTAALRATQKSPIPPRERRVTLERRQSVMAVAIERRHMDRRRGAWIGV